MLKLPSWLAAPVTPTETNINIIRALAVSSVFLHHAYAYLGVKTPIFGMAGGLIGVLLGAFGAHDLAARLSADMQAIWHTAVQYQFYHALALLAVGPPESGAVDDDVTPRLDLPASWGTVCNVTLDALQRRLGNHDALALILEQRQAHQHAGLEHAIGVIQHGTHHHTARHRINARVNRHNGADE